MEEIGGHVYLNLVLVSLGARNACLLADNIEFSWAKDFEQIYSNRLENETYEIYLERAKKLFPRLYYYNNRIVSLNPITEQDLALANKSQNELGRLINFPNYQDWDDEFLFKESIHYFVRIYITMKNGKEVNIMANMCIKLNLKPFEDLAKKYYKALISPESPVNTLIKSFRVEYEKCYPLSYYEELLYKDKKLSEYQVEYIIDELFFSDLVSKYKFNTKLGRHRGVLLTLISFHKTCRNCKGPLFNGSFDYEKFIEEMCKNL